MNLKNKSRSSVSKHGESKKKRSYQSKRSETYLSDKTPFGIVEAYKTIRTNLLYSIAANETKIIVISSPGPSEGKSTTCANLSITLAQTSAKVLLIDADMRKPTQHKIFRANNSTGLSKVIGGFETLNEAIKKEVMPNLDLLTSGPNPPNPVELLGSKNMDNILDKVKGQYDFIIIDTPPVNVVTDASVLLKDSVGVVLVCRQKQTTHDDLKKAIEGMKFTNVNILGIIVSFVKQQEKMYGEYKSYKKYDYEYGKN